ncbi:hypothetical protein ACFFX0_32705 [Citricoccus parietis]|uniref:Uncharacterized protein n=1 Tax=Citricoccus parietis TaxID=592307 RepID=A0ABV5G9P4_9MICC
MHTATWSASFRVTRRSGCRVPPEAKSLWFLVRRMMLRRGSETASERTVCQIT